MRSTAWLDSRAVVGSLIATEVRASILVYDFTFAAIRAVGETRAGNEG
jgi:hypothetical protein